nr:acetyl-CoA carboxylase biotin carboxyl carrier protein subunit [Bacteroidota bacterium]
MASKEESPKLRSLLVDNVLYRTTFTRKYESRKHYEPVDFKKIIAIIPGTIRGVFVKDGAKVSQNDKLLLLEAMKMKNEILAPMDGVIKKVYVKEGQSVSKQTLLIEME